MRIPRLKLLLGYIFGSIFTALGAIFMFFVSITYQLICMVVMLFGMSILSITQHVDANP